MAEISKIYYRTKLLTAISDKKLTNAIGGLIIQAVAAVPPDEKEIVAECLLKLVKESKTEDEIIDRLKV